MFAKNAAIAALALLALGGCHRNTAGEAPAAPLTQAGVLVTGGRLVLPAVPGRPAAAYFTLSNQSSAPASITQVTVEHAGKAEMHTTTKTSMDALPRLDVPAGESVLFAPGGKHVMVFDLAPSVVAGSAVEVTFTSAAGKRITGQLQVEAAGGGMGSPAMAMPGMDHDHMKM